MRKIKKLLCVCLMFALVFCFASCGNKTPDNNDSDSIKDDAPASASLSEDNFEWDGNIIIALTATGAKQKSIIIPERCEGFNGMIFADIENEIAYVSFESDKDIDLNGVFGNAAQG